MITPFHYQGETYAEPACPYCGKCAPAPDVDVATQTCGRCDRDFTIRRYIGRVTYGTTPADIDEATIDGLDYTNLLLLLYEDGWQKSSEGTIGVSIRHAERHSMDLIHKHVSDLSQIMQKRRLAQIAINWLATKRRASTAEIVTLIGQRS